HELPGDDPGHGRQGLLDVARRQDTFGNPVFRNSQGAEDQGQRRTLPENRAGQIRPGQGVLAPLATVRPQRPPAKGPLLVGCPHAGCAGTASPHAAKSSLLSSRIALSFGTKPCSLCSWVNGSRDSHPKEKLMHHNLTHELAALKQLSP